MFRALFPRREQPTVVGGRPPAETPLRRVYLASVAMNDKNGVLLMRQVLNSRIEHVALQRNKLGFKTGSFILSELTRLKRT